MNKFSSNYPLNAPETASCSLYVFGQKTLQVLLIVIEILMIFMSVMSC